MTCAISRCHHIRFLQSYIKIKVYFNVAAIEQLEEKSEIYPKTLQDFKWIY
jgi:hypothetical protein